MQLYIILRYRRVSSVAVSEMAHAIMLEQSVQVKGDWRIRDRELDRLTRRNKVLLHRFIKKTSQ